MTRANRRSVSIAPDHNQGCLSKEQKAVNTLIRQIEKRRRRLGAWEEIEPIFQRKYTTEFFPLEESYTDLQAKLVQRLDEACDQKGLTKSERRTISALITGLAGDLIEQQEDGQLKTIY